MLTFNFGVKIYGIRVPIEDIMFGLNKYRYLNLMMKIPPTIFLCVTTNKLLPLSVILIN